MRHDLWFGMPKMAEAGVKTVLKSQFGILPRLTFTTGFARLSTFPIAEWEVAQK